MSDARSDTYGRATRPRRRHGYQRGCARHHPGRDAPVITRDEIVIRAPIETIWEIQTNVDDWPSWQPDVDGAESEGPLEVGSVFRWQTAGLDITSTVEEVDAPRRIVWGGPAQGIVAVHVWTLETQGDGVVVRTAESWEGEPVEAQVESLQGGARWLAPRMAGEPQAHRRAAVGGRERRIVAFEMVRYQRSAPLLSKKPPVGPSAAIRA
jgi:uncharacterized protein YndB with AHSA1/START domain